MSIIHLRVNHCGIEIIDDNNRMGIRERATHRINAAIAELQQAVDLLEGGDENDVAPMVGVDEALQSLRRTARAMLTEVSR